MSDTMHDALRAERARADELAAQLLEARELLDAIQSGDVDALVVGGVGSEPRVYTLTDADRPYRVLIEQMREGAVTLGTNGVMLYANAAMATLLGISAQDLAGTPLVSFTATEEDRAQFEALLVSEGKGEITLSARDGTLVPALLAFSAIPPSEAHGQHMMCAIITDLSEEKRRSAELSVARSAIAAETARLEGEAALQASQAQLSLALDAGRFGAWTLDLATGDLTTSETCRRNFGRDPGAPFTYAQLHDAVHPGDHARMLAEIDTSVSTGANYDIEYRIVTPDGDIRWVAIRAQPTVGPDGNTVGLTGVSIDITSRKRDEARQSCLVMLADAIRERRDPDDLVHAASAILNRELGTSGVDYGILEPSAKTLTVDANWTSDDLALIRDVGERTRTAVERSRVDMALRESEARYRSLFESVEQGFCVFDMIFDDAGRPVDYVFVEVNPAFQTQTGLVDPVGRRISELGDGHEQYWNDLYGDIALTGVSRRLENYAQALGRWFEIFAYRVGTPEQRRVAVLFNDVSERKHAEARIRELNETLERQVAARTIELRQFRDIVEATTSPICAFDAEFRLIAFNKAHNAEFRRVNGFDTKLGDIFPDQFIAEQQPVMRALMSRALSGESFTVTQAFGRPELGQPFWEIHYTPLRDESGAVVGAFHLATDISDRLRAEAELTAAQEALRQSQKMEAMGSLTGGVAHDFNNLLTPIVGSLDMLQRKGLGNEREQRLIAGAVQSADRAKTLVQRLLAFARRQPLQSTSVDLAPLVYGMADLVSATTGPQIKVSVDAADDLPFAKVDPNQLEMAILNLAVNARDAMPDGGTLCIAVHPERVAARNIMDIEPGRYLRLSVTDTGSGMDETTLKRAIEPFFSTKGVGKGTGLGLSMAHGLASQLGGALTISSTPGIGTSVELWLPQSAPPLASNEPAADPALRLIGTGTALLVDDEDLVRLSTADMLIELGYSVVEAASAEEALKLVETGLQPDLLVTDHLMPGMSGTALARTLQKSQPQSKILVVSGYAEIEGIESDLPRLTKPFRKADLAEILATLG